jgi:hypothetical protein
MKYRKRPVWWWDDLTDWPDHLPQPGIQDIKWVELYYKWRPLIPEHKRKELRYFAEDPGYERRNRVKKHTRASKKQRKQRSRTAGDAKKPPANPNTAS